MSRPKTDQTPGSAGSGARWTFLSNYSHVLVCLTRDPEMRVRDIAAAVGVTERAIQRILLELEAEGVITRERDGRRNRYVIHHRVPLRHPLEAHRTIGDLLKLASESDRRGIPRPGST